MAHRTVAIITGAFVALLVLAPLATVWGWAQSGRAIGAADWAALRFTVLQSLLSALLSCLFAVPLARALARRRFWGRDWVMTALGAPFILPVLIAVMGVLAVFGQNGLVNRALGMFGVEPVSIYGIAGVLLVHVFFNLPLATRMIVQGWSRVPAEHLRLAGQLGLRGWAMFRVVEWPMLMRVLPPAFGIIFVICLSSFAVALTLGGGPKATTIELAIYQAFRYDFDLAKAANLALIQAALAGAAAVITVIISGRETVSNTRDRRVFWPVDHWRIAFGDGLWITAAIVFLGLPVVMVVAQGITGVPTLGMAVWGAAGRSIVIAAVSTALCLALALPLTTRWGEVIGTAGLAISPLVLGAGLFLIIRNFANPFDWALGVTCVLNAVLSLPFVLRILRPPAETIRVNYTRLAQSLGLGPIAWLRWVFIPRLRQPLGFAAGVTAALSMGDLGVIVLFGTSEQATLPLKIYQLMGAYRMDQAAAGAVVLLILSLGIFALCDYWGRRNVKDY